MFTVVINTLMGAAEAQVGTVDVGVGMTSVTVVEYPAMGVAVGVNSIVVLLAAIAVGAAVGVVSVVIADAEILAGAGLLTTAVDCNTEELMMEGIGTVSCRMLAMMGTVSDKGSKKLDVLKLKILLKSGEIMLSVEVRLSEVARSVLDSDDDNDVDKEVMLCFVRGLLWLVVSLTGLVEATGRKRHLHPAATCLADMPTIGDLVRGLLDVSVGFRCLIIRSYITS